MILVIAEKPSLGKAIADALPGRAETKDSVITKGDYTIIWAYGHLLTLKEPEDFDEKYKDWSTEDLPMYFDPWGMKVGKDTDKKPGQQTKGQRLKQIGELIKQADCIIHAGDIDEEGQLLIDELIRWFKYKGPVKRIDTNNTSVPGLQKALRNMKDNRTCEADGWSAFGRELSDAVFGFNLTRYFTVKNKTFLTVGRVQTPTLGLVIQRDALIEGHKKLNYYELFADLAMFCTHVQAKYHPNPDNPDLTDGKFLTKTFLERRGSELKGKYLNGPAVVTKKTLFESPPLPFNLTKLTSYCSKKWGYNPDDVMKITQSLRENYKAITYNRSDCQYLTEDHYLEAPETIAAAAANLGLDESIFDSEIKSRCFNDEKITAHFAIIPTTEKVDVSKLTERERNVYTAICNFYLAQFMPPAEKEKTSLEANIGNGESFKATSTEIIKPGYRDFLHGDHSDTETDDSDEDENTTSALSRIPAGEYPATVADTEIKEKETKPPSRYDQASLAADMTCISKYVADPEIKRLLLAKDKGKTGENGSIGTSATRPFIIKNLIARGFLTEKKQGKREVLISTPKGREFYEILPDEIKKADVTAKWWVMQEDIKTGAATPESMAQDVLATVREVIESGVGSMENAGAYAAGGTGVVLGTCPVCGDKVIETTKAFSCANKDCSCIFFKDNKYLKSLGKKMTATIVKGLITKGKVPLKGCTSAKTGKSFDCILKVEFGEKYPNLSIEFEDPDDTGLGCCPKCGGEMFRNKFGNYSCANWKSGCKYTIFAEIAGKKLTDANVRALLTKGQTPELRGFTSKSGGTFDAKLVLAPDGRIGFKFVDHPKK